MEMMVLFFGIGPDGYVSSSFLLVNWSPESTLGNIIDHIKTELY